MVRKPLLGGDPKELAKKYLKALKDHQQPVDSLIIFGSHATGKAYWDSDLDVAVIADEYNNATIEDQMKAAVIASRIDSMI